MGYLYDRSESRLSVEHEESPKEYSVMLNDSEASLLNAPIQEILLLYGRQNEIVIPSVCEESH